MNYFDVLENKRKHVFKYTDRIPDKEIIEDCLYKAWKTTPSKNQAMPYKVYVWGPDHKEEKAKIHELVHRRHHEVELQAVKDGKQKSTQQGIENPYYEHVKYNPYLFTIHMRNSKPNKFYQSQIKKGHWFDQGDPTRISLNIDITAVEVGLFAQNLTYYLLEKGLDISYNSTFTRDIRRWEKMKLNTEHKPVTMISCGYAKTYRYEVLKKEGKLDWDKKPELEDIIQWQ